MKRELDHLAAFLHMAVERYASWDTDLGAKVESGKADLDTLEQYAIKAGEPKLASGRQEMLEDIINQFI